MQFSNSQEKENRVLKIQATIVRAAVASSRTGREVEERGEREREERESHKLSAVKVWEKC
jgi:hypothetical protein